MTTLINTYLAISEAGHLCKPHALMFRNHRVMPKITNGKLLFLSIASPGWVFSVRNMDGKHVLESVGE